MNAYTAFVKPFHDMLAYLGRKWSYRDRSNGCADVKREGVAWCELLSCTKCMQSAIFTCFVLVSGRPFVGCPPPLSCVRLLDPSQTVAD